MAASPPAVGAVTAASPEALQALPHRERMVRFYTVYEPSKVGNVDALLPKVYWDADERLYPFAARSLLAGLEKLAEEGRAENQGGVWRLTP